MIDTTGIEITAVYVQDAGGRMERVQKCRVLGVSEPMRGGLDAVLVFGGRLRFMSTLNKPADGDVVYLFEGNPDDRGMELILALCRVSVSKKRSVSLFGDHPAGQGKLFDQDADET